MRQPLAWGDGGLKNQVLRIIEEEINPQLKLHAGNCELLEINNDVVTIKLIGGCTGCPSSLLTIFDSIVPILKEKIPEIKDVILG